MRRPNYLGIGSIKSGTTWVSAALASHPDVFMAHGKELHYFSDHYERGSEWYLRHFADAREESAVGEYSVSYMDGTDAVAQRIFEFNPDFRLVVTVRDPVERAFSHYRWLKQMGTELPSFRQALIEIPQLLSIGRYATALTPYWNRFPAEQFCYIRQADINSCPDQVCRELYGFLGVDPDYTPAATEQVIGATIQPRSRTLERLRINLHHAAMRYGAGYIITLYKQLGLSSLYRRLNNDASAVETLSEQDRLEVAPYFQDDLEEFRARTGISVIEPAKRP